MLKQYDVLILGSGTAGQSMALRLADRLRVALVTKRELADSASNWAQGGIAAVLDNTDSIEAHIQDTFVAGAGLCNPQSTRFVVENGKRAIEWLIDRGVPFTREADSLPGFTTLLPAYDPKRYAATITTIARNEADGSIAAQATYRLGAGTAWLPDPGDY